METAQATDNTTMPLPTQPTPNLLTQWLADEQRVDAVLKGGVGSGVATRAQTAGKTGLQFLQAMLRGEMPSPPMAQTLDFMLIAVGDGSAVFQGTPKASHYNPLGSVHGGWYATLLDSALGCAVHTMMPVGRTYTTAELSVNLVRAITTDVPRVRAEARVVHRGRQLATADARLVGPDGKLYAHATTTCLVFEIPGARS